MSGVKPINNNLVKLYAQTSV